MVLPVIQHRLTKIRAHNRTRLIRWAFLFSLSAVTANIWSVCTNEWLHTSEVLKYYVFPNRTADYEDKIYPPTYYKNATFGPWLFCWSDPVTEFHCTQTNVLRMDGVEDELPSDVTTSVELSVRRAVGFMLAGCVLDVFGLACIALCVLRRNAFRSLFVATLAHIFAGLANFACLIVYMSAVSKEVGNKIYRASNIDDSLFHYSYGFSLILFKASFLCTEMAALFSVIVYMSKRDERTYNAYRMGEMLRNVRNGLLCGTAKERQLFVDNERYHRHTRMNTLRRHSRAHSIGEDSRQLALPAPACAKVNGSTKEGPAHKEGLRSLAVPKTNPFVLSAYNLANSDCA